MTLYRIITPMRYGAKQPIQPGEVVDLDEAEAHELLTCGAIEESEEVSGDGASGPFQPLPAAPQTPSASKPRVSKPRAKKAQA